MEKAKQKIIHQIAENMNMGLDSYLNVETHEIISIPNADNYYTFDDMDDLYEEETEKIKRQKKALIKFEPLDSSESYGIMQAFISQMENIPFMKDLSNALEKKNPFRNFKALIESSEYKNDWFEFRINQLENKVIEHIRQHKKGSGFLRYKHLI